MRGTFADQGGLFSYIAPEARVPANHPLRKIRELVRDVLGELTRSLGRLYASEGRPSIPPEQLLSALLLQVFYGIRSERQLMEQLNYNLLYRWFVGLSPDDPIWDPTTFTKNRDRLQNGEVFAKFIYWARELTKLGHQVRLMPAKDVKAYVKRNKNDAADAEAICEATENTSWEGAYRVPAMFRWPYLEPAARLTTTATCRNKFRGGLPELSRFCQNGDEQCVVGLFSWWQQFKRKLLRCASSVSCGARGHDRPDADGFRHIGGRDRAIRLGASTRRHRRYPGRAGAHAEPRPNAARSAGGFRRPSRDSDRRDLHCRRGAGEYRGRAPSGRDRR